MSLNEELFLFNRTQGMEIVLAKIPYKKVQKWENLPPNFCTNLWDLKLTFRVWEIYVEFRFLLEQIINLACDNKRYIAWQ